MSEPKESFKKTKMKVPSSAPKKKVESDLTAPNPVVHLSMSAKDSQRDAPASEPIMARTKMRAASSAPKTKVVAAPQPPAAAKESQSDA
jgi:hypothetical protein